MTTALTRPVHAEMERLFGTDAAIGVRYLLEEGEREVTVTELDALKAQNPDIDFRVEMPDGSSSVICTEYARHIARTLPGRVKIVGFFSEDNPEAEFSRQNICDGHDFALVDGRYLVDPWIRLVEGDTGRPIVYDLMDTEEAEKAFAFYGMPDKWETVEDHTVH